MIEPLRILFVSGYISEFGDINGIATSASGFIKELSKLPVNVTILYPHFCDQKQIETARKKFRFLKANPRIAIETLTGQCFPIKSMFESENQAQRIYQFVQKRNFDFILINDIGGSGYFLCKYKDKIKAKIILIAHGSSRWVDSWKDRKIANSETEKIYKMEEYVYRRSDLILCATRYSRKLVKDFFPNAAKIKIVSFPLAIEPPEKPPRGRPTTLAFFASVADRRKGINIFLDALSEMKKGDRLNRFKKIVLVAKMPSHIREKRSTEALRDFCRQNKMNIYQRSFSTPAAAVNFLSVNRCLAVIASLDETFGYALHECLEAQIPFVCSDIPAFREVIAYSDPHMYVAKKPKQLANAITIASARPGVTKPTLIPTDTRSLNAVLSSYPSFRNARRDYNAKLKTAVSSLWEDFAVASVQLKISPLSHGNIFEIKLHKIKKNIKAVQIRILYHASVRVKLKFLDAVTILPEGMNLFSFTIAQETTNRIRFVVKPEQGKGDFLFRPQGVFQYWKNDEEKSGQKNSKESTKRH